MSTLVKAMWRFDFFSECNSKKHVCACSENTSVEFSDDNLRNLSLATRHSEKVGNKLGLGKNCPAIHNACGLGVKQIRIAPTTDYNSIGVSRNSMN